MNNKAHLRPKDYDSNGDIKVDSDLISRSKLKEALHNEIGKHALSIAIDRIIDNTPTIEERPQGEWLDVVCEHGCFFHGTCSVCKIRNDIPPLGMANFCPNCGADMRGDKDGR